MDGAGSPSPTVGPHWQVPRLDRRERVLAGVAAGIARELTVDPLWLRLSFVLLAAAGGWGMLLYGAAWAAMVWVERDPDLRPLEPPAPKGSSPAARGLGLAFVVVGLLALIDRLGAGFAPGIVWPVGILGLGLMVAWRTGEPGADGTLRPTGLQVALGLGLAVGGLGWLLAGNVDLTRAASALAAGVAVVVGLGLLSAPWWARLLRELGEERQRRIRSEERAEVAAHLHDSVLQTLALIQRHGDDPHTMVTLARRQERELRNWLDPDRADRMGGSLRGQLDRIASDVEELHGVPVEVVTVGDCLVDDGLSALLAATREAAVNAAKHSGAERIDLFAEVRPEAVELFVRDTGQGFDPAAVAPDRRGLRDSIRGRMERAGGTAEVITSPGEGTEVELRLPRTTRPESSSRPSSAGRPR
jgi:signal transduction histidine kinase